MKNTLILTILLFFGISTTAISQFRLGAGIDLLSKNGVDFGVQGKALYGFDNNFTINGSYSYYFKSDTKWSVDLGVQYRLINFESFRLAPLAGVDFTSVPNGSLGAGLQFGVFMDVPLSIFSLYIEPKLIVNDTSQLAISMGLMFW